jgi:hypothetical protein
MILPLLSSDFRDWLQRVLPASKPAARNARTKKTPEARHVVKTGIKKALSWR